MNLEIEGKFAVDRSKDVEKRINSLKGIRFIKNTLQKDIYFTHKSRGILNSNEVLRLRQDGKDLKITYKGVKIRNKIKTREEIEFDLAAKDKTSLMKMLKKLGFETKEQIEKKRKIFFLKKGCTRIEISLDQVKHLGNYVEIEIIDKKGQITRAEKIILELARKIGLDRIENKSYRELIANKRS